MRASLTRRRLLGAGIALPLSLSLPALARAAAGPQRIVTIGGALTEIVYALGAENRLVGRDSTSTFPQAAAALPDAGYMRAVSAEGVLSLDPDGILASEGAGPLEALDVLKAAGLRFDMVPDSYDREGILVKIRRTGAFLDLAPAAKVLEDEVAADLDAATTEAARAGGGRRVLFVLSTEGGRIMASGTGTAADGMLALAGLANATPGFTGYKPLAPEAIIEAAPDIVLMMARGGAPAPDAATLFADPALSQTPAAAKQALIVMDGLYLLGFGPRTASAVRDLVRAVVTHG